MACYSPPSPHMQTSTDSPAQPTPQSLRCKRSEPLTPPIAPEDAEGEQILDRAVHVLTTEATALSFVSRLYQTDLTARSGLLKAVECIVKTNEIGGKLVVCGIGKSGLVGMKIVATMKSLGLAASFLHAAEAMHGDMADIRDVRAASILALFSGTTDGTSSRLTLSSSSPSPVAPPNSSPSRSTSPLTFLSWS